VRKGKVGDQRDRRACAEQMDGPGGSCKKGVRGWFEGKKRGKLGGPVNQPPLEKVYDVVTLRTAGVEKKG